ncbi:NAD-dependent epimerase/dehydratase family protein [Luteolibacter sp. Populi]|uniref:NAD-dependent epimerase/dehydratase family protein n=1 Tax=Luteolibacter sp. Populi TaxID=3230487 RepID=UPI0034653776
MRIFLTGGTGLIGSHFLELALRESHAVVALRRPASVPRVALTREPLWIEGDLDQDWSSALRGCDALVHLAAHGMDLREADWEACFRWNVSAALKLWVLAVDAGVQRLVIAGSCFEYGRSGERFDYIPVTAPLEPTAPYHSSKAAASMAALGLGVERKLELIILRPFHVYGPGEPAHRFWPSLRRAAAAGEDFPMSKGAQVRDFVPAEQVARNFLNALVRTDLAPGNPLIENVGSGRPQSLLSFAEQEWKAAGARGRLLPGALPMRAAEVMRYVPQIDLFSPSSLCRED